MQLEFEKKGDTLTAYHNGAIMLFGPMNPLVHSQFICNRIKNDFQGACENYKDFRYVIKVTIINTGRSMRV